ncbi:MAG TPA: alginate lyase family protein [Gammaproteobacteria bacterium]
MKIENLLRADIYDVASRGWQELSRTMDRVAVNTDGVRNSGLFEHLAPQPVAEYGVHDGAPDAWRQHGASRFFAGAGDSRLASTFAQRLPEAVRRAVHAADALCDRSFNLLGHRALFTGDNIDWHQDMVSGQRAPLVHWSRINPLDADAVGDSKVTWELNRHQWLVHLGQAYRLTGDEKYAQVFADSVRDWMDSNPAGMGINWASSLEVSYRLISWCWALNLFRGSPALTPGLHADLLGWLRAHAAHVERYLSHYFSPNTHLTGEALGLFYAGVLFPDLPRAQRWRRLGSRILVQQLSRQVHADGVYFEQSTCYERYTVEIYLHFMVLATRNGISLPDQVSERVCKMLDHLLAVCRPDGSMPQVGDSDGGRVMPLAQRHADDCKDVFSVAAVLFGRGDYAWAAGGLTPEVGWLMGSAGIKVFEALKAEAPERNPSQLYPQGGQAVMRGSWDRDAHQLLFDTGPLGCRISGGHGHADLLAIQCSTYGRAQVVDPGTYCYTPNPHWRDHFRASQAHSTVVVDHKSQAVPVGPFSWRDRPTAQLRHWSATPMFDYADAEHHAYRRLKDPVTHRRRVLFVKPHYWVVVDDLSAVDIHEIDVLFQFAPGQLRLGKDSWAVSADAQGRGLAIRAFSSAPLHAEVRQGQVEPIRGWISPDYGLRVPAPQLSYTAVTKLPLRVVSLLLPQASDDQDLPAVTLVQKDGHTSLIIDGGRETVRVDDRQVTVERTGGVSIMPLSPS